ncbi:DNA polymerase III subunit beta [Kitasatospora sp. MMS16-BH015]|uniref:DNA polymerase III subunit beta n=1 Tax=Kitasatospora sp. MMS16-BH015 TaxID=2018025 RepID=UPI000CA0EAFA|nr:DNA polymerase III subunit beta [Kitasatospora sp. MMS16-BH015]AUG75858.1 DNA polymerase III subunit beta [Kitasatospora sp. MMS16-BH015]
MKLRLDRAAFSDTVAWAARALPHRPTLPVLAGILLTASDRTLTAAAFDFEVSTTFEVEAEVLAPGTALVSGRLLADLSRALPDQPVELTSDTTDTVLTCGQSQFALPHIPREDYPRLPDLPPIRGTADAAAFAAAVAQVAIVAARDDTLPVLTAIRLEINAERLRLVATDRYRLAVRDLPWQPADPQAPEAFALVPARILHDITKALAKAPPGDRVTIALHSEPSGTGGLIGLRTGARQATTRLLDSAFPNYETIFPTTYTGSATVERLPLLEAAKRIALVADNRSPLRITLSAGRITLDAGNSSDARGRETLPSPFHGEPICIPANAAYLVEGINALTTPMAELSYTTATKPAVLTGRTDNEAEHDPSYRYLFMPLRST